MAEEEKPTLKLFGTVTKTRVAEVLKEAEAKLDEAGSEGVKIPARKKQQLAELKASVDTLKLLLALQTAMDVIDKGIDAAGEIASFTPLSAVSGTMMATYKLGRSWMSLAQGDTEAANEQAREAGEAWLGAAVGFLGGWVVKDMALAQAGDKMFEAAAGTGTLLPEEAAALTKEADEILEKGEKLADLVEKAPDIAKMMVEKAMKQMEGDGEKKKKKNPLLARKTDEHFAVTMAPDVCRTPPTNAPVPYQLIRKYGNAENVTTTVFANGTPCFVQGSVSPGVVGDAPGTGGGVKSGTNVHIAEANHVRPKIKFEGKPVTYEGAEQHMNKRNQSKGKLVCTK